MNKIQAEKNIFSCKKYVLIFVVLVFVIGAGILVYLKNGKEPTPIPPKEEIQQEKPQEKPTPAPIPTPPEEKWETYSSDELGFSIKYPQMVYGLYRCSPDKPFWVPLKVFENKESGIVYITQEYYYDDLNSETQTNAGTCEKINYSLELLKNEWRENVSWDNSYFLQAEKTFLGWGILIENIKNENELDKFIRDNYGSDCFINDKLSWKKNEIYEINIGGKYSDNIEGINPKCPLHYAYKVLYAPKKNKLASIKLGQECTFYIINSALEMPKCYDEEMIDSFEFK